MVGGRKVEHPSRSRLEAIKRSVGAYFPGLDGADLDAAAVWRDFRPLGPDGLPYLGVAPQVPNVVIATGHAMMGFSTGPSSGRIVADLAEGDPPPFDVRALRPERDT